MLKETGPCTLISTKVHFSFAFTSDTWSLERFQTPLIYKKLKQWVKAASIFCAWREQIQSATSMAWVGNFKNNSKSESKSTFHFYVKIFQLDWPMCKYNWSVLLNWEREIMSKVVFLPERLAFCQKQYYSQFSRTGTDMRPIWLGSKYLQDNHAISSYCQTLNLLIRPKCPFYGASLMVGFIYMQWALLNFISQKTDNKF